MRNIRIVYVLSFLWRSWFWLGIWILYYLRFTNYEGIGFLEAVMITTSTLGEIPTGAVADLVGKKYALIIAFLLSAIGNLMMGLAPSYSMLLVSIITMTAGGAFYSGTMEALVYDTLKERKKEKTYQGILGKMTTMQNLGMALAGITGGFLYKINVSFPFFAVTFAYSIGIFLCFFLTEPSIDTEKFSFGRFFSQTIQGFHQLFKSSAVARQTLLLLIPAAIMLVTENVLNDASAVEYGFTSIQLGILATVLYLCGAFASHNMGRFLTFFKRHSFYALLLSIYVVSLLVAPLVTLYFGGLVLIVRYTAQTLYGNFASVVLNEHTDSRYRATTLSTYSLIENIPYVLAATGIGTLMNIYTAKTFSSYLGIGVAFVVILMYFLHFRFVKKAHVSQ